jgi:hypothetical protein
MAKYPNYNWDSLSEASHRDDTKPVAGSDIPKIQRQLDADAHPGKSSNVPLGYRKANAAAFRESSSGVNTTAGKDVNLPVEKPVTKPVTTRTTTRRVSGRR